MKINTTHAPGKQIEVPSLLPMKSSSVPFKKKVVSTDTYTDPVQIQHTTATLSSAYDHHRTPQQQQQQQQEKSEGDEDDKEQVEYPNEDDLYKEASCILNDLTGAGSPFDNSKNNTTPLSILTIPTVPAINSNLNDTLRQRGKPSQPTFQQQDYSSEQEDDSESHEQISTDGQDEKTGKTFKDVFGKEPSAGLINQVSRCSCHAIGSAIFASICIVLFGFVGSLLIRGTVYLCTGSYYYSIGIVSVETLPSPGDFLMAFMISSLGSVVYIITKFVFKGWVNSVVLVHIAMEAEKNQQNNNNKITNYKKRSSPPQPRDSDEESHSEVVIILEDSESY